MEKTNMNTTQSPNISIPDGVNPDYDYNMEWIVTESLTVPLAVLALYLAITQIAYCVIERRNAASTEEPGRNKNKKAKRAVILNVMLAFAAVFAFLRVGIDLRLPLGRFNDYGCDVGIKFKLFNYVISINLLYLLLWLRQRIFYSHPTMKFLNTRLIRFFGWSTAAIILLGLISTSTIFLVAGKYVGTQWGCVIHDSPLIKIRWMIMISCTIVSQLLLLSLFVYPLVKHRLRSSVSRGSSTHSDSIIQLIKRATVTTAICIATDLGFALVIFKFAHKIMTMTTFLYDVNILVNVICVICSFPNWRVRMLGCSHRKRDGQGEQEVSTMSGRVTSDV